MVEVSNITKNSVESAKKSFGEFCGSTEKDQSGNNLAHLYFVDKKESGLEPTGREQWESHRTWLMDWFMDLGVSWGCWKQRLEQDEIDESGKMNPNLAVTLIIPLFPQMKY